MDIQIKTREQVNKEFIEAYNAVKEGRKVKRTIGVYFTSLDAVRNFLTERRLGLLHIIRERHPRSIYELAKMAGRDFKNVYTDIMLLKEYGLVHLERRRKKSNKIPAHSLAVPYREINIHASV